MLCVSCVKLQTQAQTNHFQAEGILTSISYSSSGQVQSSRALGYRVTLRGSTWGLRMQDLDSSDGAPGNEGVVLLASDGVDIFRLITFSQAEMARAQTNADPGGRPINKITNFAGAYPGPYPFKEPFLTRVLWLAFCSGSFMATNDQQRMLYPGTRPMNNVDMAYDWTPLDAELRIPSQVDFFQFQKKEGPTPGALEETRGLPAGKYRTLAVTNFSGIMVPTQFEFLSFYGGDSKLISHLRTRVYSTVTGVRPAGKAEVVFPLPAEANVVESRFADLYRPLNYVKMGNGTWLDRRDPEILSKLKALAPRRPTRRFSADAAIAIAMVLLALLSVIIYRKFITK